MAISTIPVSPGLSERIGIVEFEGVRNTVDDKVRHV